MASRTAMKPLFRCFPRRLAATTPALSRSIHTSIQSSRQIASAFPSCARRASPVNTTLRSQKRWHSVPASKSKVYDFQQIQEASSSPSSERILIDVREPHEYTAGFIPTAINIPITSNPEALFLPPDEFEDRFGFPKPETSKEVVFYCKAGVRSSAAAKLAEQSGYENIAEYRGSWLDWQKQGGKVEMP